MRNRFTARNPLAWMALMGCLIALAPMSPASAVGAAELLEKGIYAEETVGDLNEAIRVYEQVVTEGKQARKAAAEAQLRIGLCYKKLGKTDQANAAFQRVVDDYPAQTEMVARAKEHLPAAIELIAAPWGDGDELHLEMKLANGMGVGKQIYRVDKTQLDGKDVWECSTWQLVTLNGQHNKSHVIADMASFAPIRSRWDHTMLGSASATYAKDKVAITVKSRAEPTTLDLNAPVYDNEQAAEVFRRLPLAVGYETNMTVVSTLGTSQVPLGIEVTKTETIDVPAGKFDCFCLKLNIGQTFWISNDKNRYIVRFDGGGVSASLTRIVKPNPNQSTSLKLDRFSMTLPPDWFAYTPSGNDKDDRSTSWLIDPQSILDGRVESGSLDTLQAEHDSPTAWLESALDENRKHLQDVALSDTGIEKAKVGGREAATATFTFVDGGKKMTAHRVAVFGESSAVILRFNASTQQYPSLQPAIKSIVSGLSVE